MLIFTLVQLALIAGYTFALPPVVAKKHFTQNCGKGDLGEFKCLKLGRPPDVGDNLFTVGSPGRTNRKVHQNSKARDSDGKQFYMSFGERVEQDFCESNELKSGKSEIVTTQHSTVLSPVYRKMGFIQTNIDFVGGNSGGPLLNDNLEVTGIASLVSESNFQNNKRECRGITFFEPIDKLNNNLHLINSEFDITSLSCSEEAVKKLHDEREI